MKHALLVDDLPDALEMMASAVQEAFPGIACSRADSVASARALLDESEFDIALIDLGLPDGSGISLIATLANRQPRCIPVVATILDDDEHLFRALQAGAQGYLLKDHPSHSLTQPLQGIATGQPPLSPAIARRLLKHFQGEPATAGEASALSPRERDVLSLLAKGIRINEIAELLNISRHTAGDHVKNIYRKLNISSRAEAALSAIKLGLM